MIENRELTMDDYLAMLRRRAKMILIPGAAGAGGGVSGLVLLSCEVHLAVADPGGRPEGAGEHGAAGGLARSDCAGGDAAAAGAEPEPAAAHGRAAVSGKNSQQAKRNDRRHPGRTCQWSRCDRFVADRPSSKEKEACQRRVPVPGFYVQYTAPHGARSTADLQRADLAAAWTRTCKSVQAAATGTSDVLSKGLEDAKRNLDDLDAQAGGLQETVCRTASGR